MDIYERNTLFYAIGGVSRSTMRKMTDMFLDLIGFNLIINEEDFSSYLSKVKREIAAKFALLGLIVVLERNIH